MSMTAEEVQIAREDQVYWNALERVGWRLIGFTYRESATYVDQRGSIIQLTGEQRDDIISAINRAALGG